MLLRRRDDPGEIVSIFRPVCYYGLQRPVQAGMAAPAWAGAQDVIWRNSLRRNCMGKDLVRSHGRNFLPGSNECDEDSVQ